MFPCGQNYASLCLNPAIQENATPKNELKNFHVVTNHSIQKIANKIGMDVDIATQK